MALAVEPSLCDAGSVKRIATFAALATIFAGPLLNQAEAQATSVKRITRGLPTSSPDPAAPGGGRQGGGGPPPPPGAPGSARQPAPPTTQVIVSTNLVPAQKTDEEKAELLKKTIEFQKRRAGEGSATSQYDLGMRYLKGDGVEKNLEEARKWLELSAKGGNNQAKAKLEELDKK
jgi:TPR repeat protein